MSTMSPLHRIGAAVTAVALAFTIASCSSSKHKTASTTTPAGSTSAATSASVSASSPGAGNSGSAADVAAITHAYTAFFSPTTPLDTSVGLVQDGEAFRQTLIDQGKTSNAQHASATVSKVVVNSPNRATVTFSILLSGSPVLPNQTGYAVKEGGTWKVSGATFCALLTAAGSPPAACKTAAATALPS
jgi:hypothetical protein